MTEEQAEGGRRQLEDLVARYAPWRLVTTESAMLWLQPACWKLLVENPIEALEDFEEGGDGLVYYTLIDERGECILEVS